MISTAVQHAASAQRRGFDDLALLPVRRTAATPAAIEDLPELLALAAAEIPALAAAGSAVQRVQNHNPESIWRFSRGGQTVGCYAMLHLNAAGAAALVACAFDARDPDTALLARPGETVAAIYKWAVVAPGLAAEGIRAVSRHLQSAPYADADLYARATTQAAARLMAHLGFVPVSAADPERLRYVRKARRMDVNFAA